MNWGKVYRERHLLRDPPRITIRNWKAEQDEWWAENKEAIEVVKACARLIAGIYYGLHSALFIEERP